MEESFTSYIFKYEIFYLIIAIFIFILALFFVKKFNKNNAK